jgi:hypothetical protein
MAWVAVGSAVASAGISYGAKKLFGDDGNPTGGLTSFAPPGVNAGGLDANYSGGKYTVTPNGERVAAVNNLSSTFGKNADELAALRATVAPGFSGLRTAALGQVENGRTSAIGNLRDNLARRRVLGSSFANDAASRTEAEFSQQKAQVEAQSYLQELEATNNLIQSEYAARRGVYTTALDELNLEATMGANLASKATDVLGKNAQTEALLAAQAQQGAGKFLGTLTQPVADAAGKGVGNFFKPSAAGSVDYGDGISRPMFK